MSTLSSTGGEAATAAHLAHALAARADALAARALRAMYANPFWEERYGERGHRFAAEDGRHHVGYLVEALRAGSPDTLTRYARWLQSVLVARGMCSRHLAQHFARLAEAIRANDVPDAARAVEYLAAAEDALLYEGSAAARAIQEQVERPLAATAVEADPASLAYYASYLADAVALGRPEVLADYVRWVAAHLVRHSTTSPVGLAAQLIRQLEALETYVAVLQPDAREAARTVLDVARDAARDAARAADRDARGVA